MITHRAVAIEVTLKFEKFLSPIVLQDGTELVAALLIADLGVDLNEQVCRCQDDLIDPRWGALVDLARARTPDAN